MTYRNHHHSGVDSLVVLYRMYQWVTAAITENLAAERGHSPDGDRAIHSAGVLAGLHMALGKTCDLIADHEMIVTVKDLANMKQRDILTEVKNRARKLERTPE